MTKAQYKRQRNLKRTTRKSLLINIIVCFILIIITTMINMTKAEETKPIENVKAPTVITHYPEQEVAMIYNRKDWNDNDDYLLAKIAMAEAEGCSTETKCLVIMTVLNRVKHNEFPDTIKEVIYQKRGKVYQFTPVGNGRWDRVEPNQDCWLALDTVMATKHDFSMGALYFESCANENNWHSRNLNFICKSDEMRFYK